MKSFLEDLHPLLWIAAFVVGLLGCAVYRSHVEDRRTYQAWLSEHPESTLTLEHFVALKNAELLHCNHRHHNH